MSDPQRNPAAGSSAFSVYASKFLTGKLAGRPGMVQGSQIFRPPSPTSPSHDPFMTSPTASQSQPHLAGSSRSPSPARTPPFPGPGLDAIPDIDNDIDGSNTRAGFGLLFGGSEDNVSSPEDNVSSAPITGKARANNAVPNPYAPSSDSDEEQEADLEDVATVRRSLLKKPISERAKKGWLAHQSIFPPSSSSSETESDKDTEAETEDEAYHSRMMGRSRHKSRSHSRELARDHDQESYMLSPSELYHATIKQTPNIAHDLNEPLLGPDELDEVGTSAKVPVRLQLYHGRFGHWEREGLRKYKDSAFLGLWLSSLLGVLVGLFFVWGSTDPPPDGSNRSAPSVVPLLPLLIVLLIPSLVLPPAFLLLLRKTVRPVLWGTIVLIPFSLFICGWWALAASFETAGLDGSDPSDKWWGTTGLRLCASALWLLAAAFGRLVWIRRKRLERTTAVVELSTNLLLTHPPLLLLTPLLLGVFAITSIPFLTLLIRLGTIGYWRHPRENTYVFHLRPYAGWLIFLVTLVWIWTWGVIRGVGRVAVAAVVGEWYFHRDDPAHPPPLEVSTAAVHRATGTSLGSICLGAGIVAIVRVVGRSAAKMRHITSPKSKVLPSPLSALSKLAPVFAVVAGVLDQLNGYALVYVGITGEAFWPSARRAVGLAGKGRGGRLLDYTLIKLLLTLSSTAMGLFTAMAGYLYMTRTLGNPGYAPVAALLCGGLPFLAIRACASVLGDAADALFICHQIDREVGGGHCDRAKEAFEGDLSRGPSAV